MLKALAADRRAYEAKLGEDHFALTEEEMGLLDTDPAAFVRMLGGRATYIAATASIAQLLKFAPLLIRAEIEATTQRTARATDAQSRFRAMWPQLGTAHDKEVGEAVRNFRAINPSADMETALRVVGQLVALQHGLSPQPAGATAQPSVVSPAVRQPAFVPAGTAVDVVPPIGTDGVGMWDGLIEPID